MFSTIMNILINNSNGAVGGNWGIAVKTELVDTPGLLKAHFHKHL
jgi:hypothetical protein